MLFMKQKNFLLILFLILFIFLIPFFIVPSFTYRLFPQAPISLRRAGAFSAGWSKKDDYPLPKRMVLGTKDLLTYSMSYHLVGKQASPLILKDCQENLNSWLSNQPGKWGIVVYDPIQKEKFSFKSKQKFHAASVMKLATAVSVFNWMEENKKELDSLVWGQSLRHRLTLLINKSDNNQWADLGTLVTLPKTQKILEENGLIDSDIYTNTMTANDVFLLLKKIYQENLLNEKHREFLFNAMQNTINEKRIPAGVPEEIPVVHKYGIWQSNVHDAGIVFYEKPYIIVALTKNAPQAEQKIAELSKKVYKIFSKQDCSL